MSNLTERCEQRKAEAQALADKYNALDIEEKKIANQKAQLLAEFNVKNAQYAFFVNLPESFIPTPTLCHIISNNSFILASFINKSFRSSSSISVYKNLLPFTHGLIKFLSKRRSICPNFDMTSCVSTCIL